jgi:uncharacterized protein YndB with AHSA1/START domain
MTAVHLTRTYPAPPARVFRAWLDPDLLAQWMRPNRVPLSKADIDPRPGGHFHIYDADNSGFEATILEIDEPAKLVFRWAFVGPQRDKGGVADSLLTVTFEPAPGDATLLTLVHERLDSLAATMPQVAARVEDGWRTALDNLAGVAL